MFSISQIEDHLTGMGHGGTLNKVRNIEALYERAAARLQAKGKIVESMRLSTLAQAIYDDLQNYTLPSDYNDLIDLIPQDDRQSWDKAFRTFAGKFDLQKGIRNRTMSIEGNNGLKMIRINWKSRASKVLNTMNSYNGNGTWAAVGSATGVATDTIFKLSGGGSVVFNHVASGDGIQNTTMTALDLTTENGVSDEIFSVYLSALPTSITPVWGNNLTTKFWTGVAAATQADGTAFKIGWNTIAVSWAAATQTGTVAPATVNSAKLTFQSTGALGKIRVENITFAIGRNFDIKYYSKYLFMTAAGVWESRPQTGIKDDLVVIDNDSLPLFLMECLVDMAQQMEGTDSAFDIKFAEQQMMELYPIYKGRFPSQVTKTVTSYGSLPRTGGVNFRRWKV